MSNKYSNLTPSSNAYGLLRLPQVMQLVGLSRSTIFAKIKTGDFPRPTKIGARIIAAEALRQCGISYPLQREVIKIMSGQWGRWEDKGRSDLEERSFFT